MHSEAGKLAPLPSRRPGGGCTPVMGWSRHDSGEPAAAELSLAVLSHDRHGNVITTAAASVGLHEVAVAIVELARRLRKQIYCGYRGLFLSADHNTHPQDIVRAYTSFTSLGREGEAR